MHTINHVPKNLVPFIWPRVAKLFEKSIELACGECTENTEYDKLMTGRTSLFIVQDKDFNISLAFTTHVMEYDTGLRAMYIPMMGGTGLDSLCHIFMPAAIGIAKINKCTEIRGMSVRNGWLRKLKKYGWESVHEVIHYKIGE